MRGTENLSHVWQAGPRTCPTSGRLSSPELHQFLHAPWLGCRRGNSRPQHRKSHVITSHYRART
eukprot:3612029-Rhodomonas_salina.7